MNLSRACGYAVRALVLLARQEAASCVPSHDLARMRAGPMDPAGGGATLGERRQAVIGTLIGAAGFVVVGIPCRGRTTAIEAQPRSPEGGPQR